jgi:hypothetical protein
MAAFWNVYGWELMQNSPFVMGIVAAMRLWHSGQTGWAALVGLAGCMGSAAAITLTEAYKLRTAVGQSRPSRELGRAAQIREFVINSLSFAGGSFLVALYVGPLTQFGSLQHNWITDAMVGGLAGAAVAAVQNAVGPPPPNARSSAWPHILAFAVMGPLVLVWVRVLISLQPWLAGLAGSLGLALLMTLIICGVEYGPNLKTV